MDRLEVMNANRPLVDAAAEQNNYEQLEQSRLAQLGASVTEFARNHMPNRLTTGIAVAAIAIGGGKELASASTEPANSIENTPALTGNALKQECVSEGLEMPIVVSAKMFNPGRKHNPRIQQVTVKTRYDALPDDCNGSYRRFSHMTARLQSPKNPKKWYSLQPGLKWDSLYSYDATTNTGGNKAGRGGSNITSNGHEGDNVFYKCAKGKRKTRAKIVLRNQVKDLKTGNIVGQKFKKHPIKITGGGC